MKYIKRIYFFLSLVVIMSCYKQNDPIYDPNIRITSPSELSSYQSGDTINFSFSLFSKNGFHAIKILHSKSSIFQKVFFAPIVIDTLEGLNEYQYSQDLIINGDPDFSFFTFSVHVLGVNDLQYTSSVNYLVE